jgi:hypothetical protein
LAQLKCMLSGLSIQRGISSLLSLGGPQQRKLGQSNLNPPRANFAFYFYFKNWIAKPKV